MKKILVVAMLFFIWVSSFAMSGYVVKVSDGDTFILKSKNERIKVRMYGIDAPELKQKYGKESKKYLEDMILGKKVKLNILYEDKYERKVARVYINKKEANLEMLKSGYAWFYKYHAQSEISYKLAQESAQRKKLGLWQDKNPKNPRNFRVDEKKAS